MLPSVPCFLFLHFMQDIVNHGFQNLMTFYVEIFLAKQINAVVVVFLQFQHQMSQNPENIDLKYIAKNKAHLAISISNAY